MNVAHFIEHLSPNMTSGLYIVTLYWSFFLPNERIKKIWGQGCHQWHCKINTKFSEAYKTTSCCSEM